MNDNNSLAHTSWNCKYHIVFAPKYRRKILLNEYKVEEDMLHDQMTLRDLWNPFTGSK